MGLSVGDCKDNNYGLKMVSYTRVYHLGEDVYAFSFNEMPVRIDLEEFFTFPHPTDNRFGSENIRCCFAETQNGKDFVHALRNREDDIFTLFKRYFRSYLIDPASLNNQENVRNFYVDKKWIDQEQKLPRM